MPAPPVSHDPLVSEIRMLLDFVTGSPVQTLKDLVIPDPDHPQTGDAAPITLRNAAVLNRLNDLEAKITAGGCITSSDRTFLQLLRDALGTMVRPATGLTIAYTSMVVGRQRGRNTQSRAQRAEQAYAALAAPATRHRWAQRILLCIAVAITGFAVWESAHVALGRSLLLSVQSLQTQQAAISQEMNKLLDASRPAPLSTPASIGGLTLPAGPILRLCDRPRVLAFALQQQAQQQIKSSPQLPIFQLNDTQKATLFESPAQQSLCDRDAILAAKFTIAHDGLLHFMSDWTSVIIPGDSLRSRMLTAISARDPAPAAQPSNLLASLEPDSAPVRPVDPARRPTHIATEADVDFAIGPVLLILGNYVLPIVFALLGATVYVILDFYSKVRDSLLAPATRSSPGSASCSAWSSAPASACSSAPPTRASPRREQHWPTPSRSPPPAWPLSPASASRVCSACSIPWSAGSSPATRTKAPASPPAEYCAETFAKRAP